jgi:hypothetical protein
MKSHRKQWRGLILTHTLLRLHIRGRLGSIHSIILPLLNLLRAALIFKKYIIMKHRSVSPTYKSNIFSINEEVQLRVRGHLLIKRFVPQIDTSP